MSITSTEASDLFRREPHRYLNVGDAEVAYRRVGTGPDVLFVHGWPLSSATFRKLLPHLADRVTCHLIDLPGAGSSRFDANSTLSLAQHIETVRRSIDLLGLESVGVVGHDSGGLIARYAVATDPRLRALALIDTEQSHGITLKFRSFLAPRHVPGFGAALGWLAGQPRLRRSPLVLGDAFVDRSLLDGEFDEFFLQPLHRSPEHLRAAMRVLKSFDYRLVHELESVHRTITAPVLLVWGEQDRFFPVERAHKMVDDFPDARIEVIAGAGLCAHEERPHEVAEVLLSTLAAS